MFSFIKNRLKKIYSSFTSALSGLFGRTTIDEQALKELEILLLAADTGVKTTRTIIEQLKTKFYKGELQEGNKLKAALSSILNSILNKADNCPSQAPIQLLVGINGSGKTTCAGKLAYHYNRQGKKVLLVAADTFRAAAPEQLTRWAEKSGVDIVLGTPGQDPASVVFTGCTKFNHEGYDLLIVDTAGRLHTKANLMNELAKIKRVITKQLPDKQISTLLTIDAMLGQNSFEQAKIFKECMELDSIVLTKMDGTGKGGIVFAIVNELEVPIGYITFGEKPDQLKEFNSTAYIQELIEQ